MMRKAFTLLELLVVVGIMGLLGTISVGAYRSVVRGMEERGAIQAASQFVHAAFQRAMIDRQPTAVYFWNETLRASTADENEIVVGKAVAVRRAGRITGVDGQYLYDEFADLNRSYSVSGDSQPSGSGMYLYQLDNISSDSNFKRSRVYDVVHKSQITETYLMSPADGSSEPAAGQLPAPADRGKLDMYGFVRQSGGGDEPDWAVGDAYGFEFQSIELPKNYIFGSQYSTTTASPVREAGVMVFGGSSGGYENRSQNASSTRTIEIRALRPDKTGNLTSQVVGKTEDPTEEQN